MPCCLNVGCNGRTVSIITCLHYLQVLRLEPHCVISNRTGMPLQIMHHSPSNKLQRLGDKASGVQPSQGQQPSRTPPGLKGVVADPRQDWTSCMDVPAGTLTPLPCACNHTFRGSVRIKCPAVCSKMLWTLVPLTSPLESQFTCDH